MIKNYYSQILILNKWFILSNKNSIHLIKVVFDCKMMIFQGNVLYYYYDICFTIIKSLITAEKAFISPSY